MRIPTAVLMGLLLTPAVAAPAAAAPADTSPPQLRSITLSRTEVTVTRTDVEFVTVDVRLTDDSGVEEWVESIGFFDPILLFPDGKVHLRLSSGTPQDGVWSGIAVVTSEWRGALQPTRVVARDAAQNRLSVDPRTVVDTPTLVAHGSHSPAVAITFSPNPAVPNGPVVKTVRTYDRDTLMPWPRLPIALGVDSSCPEDGITGPSARTDALGLYRETLPAGRTYDFVHCAWVPAANAPGQRATRIGTTAALVKYQYKYAVTATPAARSARAGTNVAVTGNVNPASQRKTVYLQRRSGTQWRTVNTGQTRPSSRYTLTATPPRVGSWSYRVYVPGQPGITGAVSRTFTIRGT